MQQIEQRFSSEKLSLINIVVPALLWPVPQPFWKPLKGNIDDRDHKVWKINVGLMKSSSFYISFT